MTLTRLSTSKNSAPCVHTIDHLSCRLRHRIHTPYESLQIHVLRLQKFQQASDLLRRTSRFVILARRLQLQMNEMESTDTFQDGGQVERDSTTSITGKVDAEDEKERTISKAALSIAELGISSCSLRD